MKFVLSSLLILAANAWNGETHLMIARMAYDLLKPDTLDKA
jgi:hypothetical protein